MKTYHAYDRSFTLADMAAEWEKVPVEGAGGYASAAGMLALTDEELVRVAKIAAENRYSEDWRNPGGAWHRMLGHDTTRGAHVLDFGCGFGLEALQFAKNWNRVTLVDINESSVRLASRVLAAHGHGAQVAGTSVSTDEPPYFEVAEPVDVFYSCGSLHHCPYPREIMLRAAEVLAPGGRVVLMVYSDRGWEVTTGAPRPPVDDDTSQNPRGPKFRDSFDCVGHWADWYDRERLDYRFGDFLRVESFDYITRDGAYAAAVLVPK